MARWPAPAVEESGSAGQKRSWMPQELHHLRSHGHSWRKITNEKGISKELHSGLFLACPKTYEFRLATFLTGIVSFQDPYLISGWFMGSHRTREGKGTPDVLHP
jgi:hypothetical protein